nr:serine/arginine repetitive matrix protein 1-like [Drosophila kikkawai]
MASRWGIGPKPPSSRHSAWPESAGESRPRSRWTSRRTTASAQYGWTPPRHDHGQPKPPARLPTRASSQTRTRGRRRWSRYSHHGQRHRQPARRRVHTLASCLRRPPATRGSRHGQCSKQPPRQRARTPAGPPQQPHRHGQCSKQPPRQRARTPAGPPQQPHHHGRRRELPSPRHAPRTGPTSTAPGTHTVQAIAPLVPSRAVAAPDPDAEVEAALRECLGDLPPGVLEEMAQGAEGLDLEDLFGESPDEDGVELPMRPVSNPSANEPRTPSPQFLPEYEEISSDEGVEPEIIQISDSDDAEPDFRPPGTPPPAYEDIFGPGPYATSCPIPTCAASTPSQSPPTTSRGYHAAAAPRRTDGPTTSRLVDLTTSEDSANDDSANGRPAVYAAAVARRRAEELSDELGSSSAGPVQPTDAEPRSARDRPPTPAPARRGRRRSAPWADSPSGSSSEEELPPERQGHARWLPVPDGWSTPNGTLPAALIRRIQQRLLIARRRARRYLEEEQGQRFRVQLNRDDHVRVFLYPTRK